MPSSDLHRRAFVLAVYREQYTAYEDLGVLLDSFLAYVGNASRPPLQRMMSYSPVEVRLSTIWSKHNVTSGDSLFRKLNLQHWIPTDWRTEFPKVDLTKVLRRLCWFAFDDCTRSQRPEGVRVFNKIKHGLLLVPNARRFRDDWLDAPAILMPTLGSDETVRRYPLTAFQLKSDEADVESRLMAIHAIQNNLRLLAALHVRQHYPAVLEQRGLPTGASLLKHKDLLDSSIGWGRRRQLLGQGTMCPWRSKLTAGHVSQTLHFETRRASGESCLHSGRRACV